MAELNVIKSSESIFPNIDAGATGRHVYHLLCSRGYKAKDVAQILGCDPKAVYNWSYGSRMPSIDNLDRLSRLLNISINDLLVHDGDEEVTVFPGTKKIRRYLRRIITVLPRHVPSKVQSDLRMKIGRSTFLVKLYFKKDDTENLKVKVKNLIRKNVGNPQSGLYPQARRQVSVSVPGGSSIVYSDNAVSPAIVH